jgi:hypothetical protein
MWLLLRKPNEKVINEPLSSMPLNRVVKDNFAAFIQPSSSFLISTRCRNSDRINTLKKVSEIIFFTRSITCISNAAKQPGSVVPLLSGMGSLKKIIAVLIVAFSSFAFLLPAKKPTVFLTGDSTCANKPVDDNPERGWGQLIPKYFTDEISIQNHAVNGRSTKSFINEHRWDTVLSRLQEGDYVMIQFGHNDEKLEDSTRSAPNRAAEPKKNAVNKTMMLI